MGDRGSKKAYTPARTGMYLHTKFGCDRSIVVGCRSRNDRQTYIHTYRQTNIRSDNKAHSLRDVTQQTDGIAMAYTRYSYAVARKKIRNDTHRLTINKLHDITRQLQYVRFQNTVRKKVLFR